MIEQRTLEDLASYALDGLLICGTTNPDAWHGSAAKPACPMASSTCPGGEVTPSSRTITTAPRARSDILRRSVPAAPWCGALKCANWRLPKGAGSSLEGRGDHPVVHVSWNDAQAYAA
ncbi:SUMF1/EgtB/PvdO family nonheme iron enzyme [Paracoccus methylovorus]|uniref:SUMF1/EgtB/PvdO family nonheme iron enzyme n=1 Tax=Paracoccus methylovorus TaxID=2812658 RepID=A0ABX7JEU5_9RHOB|nr:SUMF1/EgtB/PvdO family nonheme iron enzyme [Paracoccus methylovorus]